MEKELTYKCVSLNSNIKKRFSRVKLPLEIKYQSVLSYHLASHPICTILVGQFTHSAEMIKSKILMYLQLSDLN